ncbi:MAG: pentapeptide repeat-containing protein, partial [Caldilineaceae bacterium]|nr:pentapeptide repeat-containing protein [Caldilineaceae bacterium]
MQTSLMLDISRVATICIVRRIRHENVSKMGRHRDDFPHDGGEEYNIFTIYDSAVVRSHAAMASLGALENSIFAPRALAMASQLQISLLGPFSVTHNRQAVTNFASDKVRGLLIYLAVTRGSQPRAALASLFWPEYDENGARTNLRQTLYQLRRTLGDDQANPPYLLIDRQTIGLNPTAGCTVDVIAFQELLAAVADHGHTTLAACDFCVDCLDQAADLYHHDFLTGFALDDSQLFEEWRRVTQEQLHMQALNALRQLTDVAMERGDDAATLRYAQRQLMLEPWRESAHRQIMWLLASGGQRTAAIAQYQTCRQILAEELAVEPDAATTALYEQIRSDEFSKMVGVKAASGKGAESPPLPAAPAPIYDWGEMPAVDLLTGRATELSQLTQWLMPQSAIETVTETVSARVVTLVGIGGVGKTTLAAAAVKAVASTFTFVIWRSLVNAPPLGEILRNWLQVLSRQTITTLPTALDEQLRILLEHLRQQRCLLILDNVETILLAGTGIAGEMREGYAGYGQLFQYLSECEHRSCLLLTSREQPYALARISRQTAAVHLLPLLGLNVQDGQTFLENSGLYTSSEEASLLIQNYSGNPLALQIVASMIADFFGGDVTAFQQEEGLLFDGIRAVLDQQFARLTELEREILIWLAIEREVVTAPVLRANLAHSVPMHAFLEALQALQNRALLEKRDAGFTLQNVIIEYTTEYLVTQVYSEIVENGDTGRTGSAEPGEAHLALSFLNRFALLKAQAKEYVRQSQARLIIQSLAERLAVKVGKAQIAASIPRLLEALRAADVKTGYAAGNLLNLLLAMQIDASGLDFSGLNLRQAFLRGMTLPNVNLRGADLTHTVFTDCFSLINSVAINSAQTLFAAGTGAGEIRIWNYANRQPVAIILGRQRTVWTVAFSPDGRLLASSDDQTVQLWEIDPNGDFVSQSNYRTLAGHTSDVHALAFSPDGKMIASAGYDQSICLWDIESGALIRRFKGHSSYVYSIAFSPDGQLIASGSDDQTICLWELQSQKCRILRGHTGRVYGVAFHPQGKLLATCGADHSVRIWDVDLGELCQTLHGHTDIVRSVAFHPTGAWVASGGYDETIRLWSIHGSDAEGVRGEISQILHGHAAWVRSLTFSPDGKMLISGGIDQTIRLWGLQDGNGQAHHILHGHTNLIRAVALSPDGAILVSGSNDNAMRIWDMHQRGAVQVRQMLLGHTQMIRTIAFHPNGQIIASGGFDKKIRLWVKMADNWQLQYTLNGHTDLVRAVAFSPDGALLASAGSDQTIRLWDVASGRHLHTLAEQCGTVWSVAFHPDGQRLASGSADHTIRLWHFHHPSEAPHLYASWQAHAHDIKTVAFSPDGQLLASGSDDKIIRLWDVYAVC